MWGRGRNTSALWPKESCPARVHTPAAAPALPDALPAALPQVPPAILGLSGLTLLDLSYNALHSLRPGAYLKRLVVRLACCCWRGAAGEAVDYGWR